jgi:hypothetical protein
VRNETVLRLRALGWLHWWSLIFAGYATISDVWGRRHSGLTEAEVQEANLAYDEWDRLQSARRAWNERHADDRERGRRGRRRSKKPEKFDSVGYIEDRRQQLLDQLEAEADAEEEPEP